MPVGDPAAGNTPLGAVVDRKTVDKCYALIEDATSQGRGTAGRRRDDRRTC